MRALAFCSMPALAAYSLVLALSFYLGVWDEILRLNRSQVPGRAQAIKTKMRAYKKSFLIATKIKWNMLWFVNT